MPQGRVGHYSDHGHSGAACGINRDEVLYKLIPSGKIMKVILRGL